jgi:hypothetical protein
MQWRIFFHIDLWVLILSFPQDNLDTLSIHNNFYQEHWQKYMKHTRNKNYKLQNEYLLSFGIYLTFYPMSPYQITGDMQDILS